MEGWKSDGLGGAAQRVGEHLGLFGDDVEPEDLDRDQAVARRLIGAKNGTESANTNLMQHPEGAECWRRRESAWVLSGQRRNSSGRSSECNTNYGILGAFSARHKRGAIMRRLDSFRTALREYEFVSAEPSSSAVTTDPAGRLKATGLDVRGFPWIRPLAGDYAYNFKQVEGLYAGNPKEPDAWREAVARAQQKSRDRDDARLAPPGAAGSARTPRRRRAPRRRASPTPRRSPSSPASRPASSADRSSRCSRR